MEHLGDTPDSSYYFRDGTLEDTLKNAIVLASQYEIL